MPDEETRTSWPRVGDRDSLLKQMDRSRRSLAGLKVMVGTLIVSQVLVLSGVLNKIEADQQQRSQRFCLLTQQAVHNATPGNPVNSLLLAAAESAGCNLVIPPGTRIEDGSR